MTEKKTPRLPEIATKIYDLLEPLDGPTRTKVLQGALGMLGDAGAELSPLTPPGGSGKAPGGSPSTFATGPKGSAWLKKHSISDEMLEKVFHASNGQVELIANPPGSNMREQTINAYLLIGVQQLLQTDEPKFSEAAAVALCKRLGCYDTANHAMTRTRFGNKLTGTKEMGYTLTMPGLDQAAMLIKTPAA